MCLDMKERCQWHLAPLLVCQIHGSIFLGVSYCQALAKCSKCFSPLCGKSHVGRNCASLTKLDKHQQNCQKATKDKVLNIQLSFWHLPLLSGTIFGNVSTMTGRILLGVTAMHWIIVDTCINAQMAHFAVQINELYCGRPSIILKIHFAKLLARCCRSLHHHCHHCHHCCQLCWGSPPMCFFIIISITKDLHSIYTMLMVVATGSPERIELFSLSLIGSFLVACSMANNQLKGRSLLLDQKLCALSP